VAPSRRPILVRLGQPFGRVLTIVSSISKARFVAVLQRTDQAAINKRRKQVQRIALERVVIVDYCQQAVEVGAAAKDGRPPEDNLFGWTEQLMAPVDRPAQRRWRSGRSRCVLASTVRRWSSRLRI
jgi:hypothetical protein